LIFEGIINIEILVFIKGEEMSRQVWTEQLQKLKSSMEADNQAILDDHLEEIAGVAEKAIEILADGFQWSDILTMFEIVGPLMEIAETVAQYDGKKKEQFVVDTVWLIYQVVDGYPDGAQNRIDIPLVFGGLEKTFEKKTIDFAIRCAIKSVHRFGKNHGFF